MEQLNQPHSATGTMSDGRYGKYEEQRRAHSPTSAASRCKSHHGLYLIALPFFCCRVISRRDVQYSDFMYGRGRFTASDITTCCTACTARALPTRWRSGQQTRMARRVLRTEYRSLKPSFLPYCYLFCRGGASGALGLEGQKVSCAV